MNYALFARAGQVFQAALTDHYFWELMSGLPLQTTTWWGGGGWPTSKCYFSAPFPGRLARMRAPYLGRNLRSRPDSWCSGKLRSRSFRNTSNRDVIVSFIRDTAAPRSKARGPGRGRKSWKSMQILGNHEIFEIHEIPRSIKK